MGRKKAREEGAAAKQADPLEIARSIVDAEKGPPARRRYIINDFTVEKLGELLRDNPNGLLAFRDELVGLLKSLDKKDREEARAFMLEAWGGTGSFVYDRIGRGTVDIPAAIISVLGCVQPGPLGEYLREAIAGEAGADGLMQKFQLAVYPDVSPTWENVDRPPNRAARKLAHQVFEKMVGLQPEAVGAEREED